MSQWIIFHPLCIFCAVWRIQGLPIQNRRLLIDKSPAPIQVQSICSASFSAVIHPGFLPLKIVDFSTDMTGSEGILRGKVCRGKRLENLSAWRLCPIGHQHQRDGVRWSIWIKSSFFVFWRRKSELHKSKLGPCSFCDSGNYLKPYQEDPVELKTQERTLMRSVVF